MKKFLVRLLIVLLVLLVVAAVAVHLFLDGAIKRGVETLGPKLTKVNVRLDSVNLMLLSGSGKLNGLVVGNPEGFKTAQAISVGKMHLEVEPQSLLQDKIVVRKIQLEAPEITFETDLKGNNLGKILSNLEETTGGSAKEQPKPTEAEAKANKKLQVDDFEISGAKLHVSVSSFAGQSASVPLPTIHLSNLGSGPEGITVAELTKLVLKALEKQAAESATTAIAEMSKGAVFMSKEGAGMATNAVEKAGKSLTDRIFKK